jgi:HEAT repeat protein/tRNA A-37 threonylcarbamoyl transferase component Bud32
VRQAALVGVSKMNGAVNIEQICKLLLDPEFDVMNKAVEVIIALNKPESVRYLLPALKSENEFSRRSAVEILNEIGTTASVKYLLEAIADDDWWVRERASDALARIGGPRVVSAVLELIKDKDENIRRAAIEIINTCGDQSTVDQLIAATKDSDWWVSERAADALAGIGDSRAVPALLEMLARNDRSVPVAINALGKLGDSRVVKELLPYVRRDEKEVSIAAINAVTELADERLAEGVQNFLSKSVAGSADEAIVEAANRAIQKLQRKSVSSGEHAQTAESLSGTRMAVNQGAGAVAVTNADIEEINSTARTLLDEVRSSEDAASDEESFSDAPGLDISALQNGDLIDGRYRFIEKIGKGAFGTVLLVEDTVVEERLILKFLNPNVASDEEMMKRFVHELRYSRRITHKNVIRIYDFLYIGGGYAISMEYFPSHTLGAEIARERPMSQEKALRYAHDICVGMQIAHQQGIIHRDLKPANILINNEGLLKIVDFGVAAAAKSGDTQLTKTGYVIGSPKYMAPEQILGKKVDERADIYSLGVILYEMLAGSPPYSKGDHMSVMYQHVQGRAPAVHEVNPKISRELSEVVSKAMTVDKSKRFASMIEFQDALTRVAPPSQ